jgi:hypothetical protein
MTQHTARFCHAYSQENVKRHKSMASPVIGRHITVYVFWQIKGEASWVLTTPKSPGPTSAAIGVHTAGLTLRVQEDTLKSRMQERGLSDKRGSSYLLLNPPGDTTAGGGQNTLLSTELPQEK